MRYFWALLAYVTAIVVTAASCGGNGNTGSTGFTGTEAAGSGGGSSGTSNGGAATTASGSTGVGIVVNDGGMPPADGCAAAMTCAQQGFNCGMAPDGCGNVIDCGPLTCPNTGDTCGGGGTQFVCGQPMCTPTTCAALNYNCGMTGDGCTGTLSCGTCTGTDTCGGGGKSNVCGTGTMCTPKSCTDLGYNCGSQGDTCGNILDCGTCPSGQQCGNTTVVGMCVASTTCTPKTCAQENFNCGLQGDGCSGTINCGACTGGNTCGASMGNVCGSTIACTGLCLQQTTCPGTGTTSITGTVFAPNGVDPVYNSLVYVPNSAVQPFVDGVAVPHCSCGSDVTGSPLVSTATAVDGTFTLTNMPVGTNIPLVIQNGRWRRQIVIPNVAACTNTPVAATLTNMPNCHTGNAACPAGKAQGDIPKMAFSTGAVDSLECVLRKIGILDTEFTNPSGTGRVRFYKGNGAAGAQISGTTPTESSLWGTQAEINAYDMVLFPCQGAEYDQAAASQQSVIESYANAGGRVFATHYSYVWLFNDSPFSTTATWNADQYPFFDNDPETGTINQTFPKGLALAQWLKLLYPTSTQGQILLNTLRDDFDSVVTPPSTMWISITDSWYTNQPMHYTFDTPVGALPANQCGRVLFDDFHVEDSENPVTTGLTFPAECACGADNVAFCEVNGQCCSNHCDTNVNSATYETCLGPQGGCKETNAACTTNAQCCLGACTGGVCINPMTPQEKMLEFMLFDLGSCVTPPSCTPKTCAEQATSCGPVGDGCGNILQCGMCPSGQVCTGGVCSNGGCVPKTCMQEGFTCGSQGDGCGNVISCGTCPSGTCGGGGTPSVCGSGDCMTKSCAAENASCGSVGDGCGNIINCGVCPVGDVCTAGMCVMPMCKPKTCTQLGFNCGSAADGCGNIIMCGTCSGSQTCGGGGMSNICGGGAG